MRTLGRVVVEAQALVFPPACLNKASGVGERALAGGVMTDQQYYNPAKIQESTFRLSKPQHFTSKAHNMLTAALALARPHGPGPTHFLVLVPAMLIIMPAC